MTKPWGGATLEVLQFDGPFIAERFKCLIYEGSWSQYGF